MNDDRLIATLESLRGEVVGLRGEVAGLRREVGQVRTELHGLHVKHSDRLARLESGLPAQFRAEIEGHHLQVRTAIRREVGPLDTRVSALEDGHAKARGVLWAAGTAWAILVALPGAVASWLHWTGSGGQP